MPAEAWRARARCIGHTEVMFDHGRTDEALARCASCPVKAQCLEATMAAEADEPYYRFGVAGGYGPSDRARIAVGEQPVEHRRPAAPTPQYRRRRKCKGCKAAIRQPNVGPRKLWCSGACWRQANAARRAAIKRERWASDRDEQRKASAARKRREWDLLPEEAKEKRRAAMRVDSLTPAQRSARNARKRARSGRADNPVRLEPAQVGEHGRDEGVVVAPGAKGMVVGVPRRRVDEVGREPAGGAGNDLVVEAHDETWRSKGKARSTAA